MAKKSLPLSKVYQLLEPGPVVMLTTSRNGKANVMTMTWQMMIDFEPPIFACVISNRNYTFNILKETRECVVNITTADMAKTAVGIGEVSGRKVDKFKKFHLTQEEASEVQAPLIGECYASLECKVINTSLATKYNIFILKVVKAWVRPTKKRPRMMHHCGNGVFAIDGKIIKLPFSKK